MILDVSVYLAVFAVSAITASLYQKTYNNTQIKRTSNEIKAAGSVSYCIIGCLFLFPIIAMYGLRLGIGTDYYSYEMIYNTFHITKFNDYWVRYTHNDGIFYIEPAYYLLNRFFSSYRLLLWGIGILIFVLFSLAVKDYSKRLSYAFALFVFLSTQFVYSMNGTRFSVALGFILLAYNALAQDKIIKFIVLVLVASLFHQSALFCLAMLFLKLYKHKMVNSIRNSALFVLILLFPIISPYLFEIGGRLSFFARYFTTARYFASETMSGGWMWLLHILPVFLPLIIFCKEEVFGEAVTNTFFRICIMEIPFRMLGLYNTWYTRFARYAEIAQVILIPLVLFKIQNKSKKIALYIYYIAWFIFYFAYYAIVNDAGDSLPYTWIFS